MKPSQMVAPTVIDPARDKNLNAKFDRAIKRIKKSPRLKDKVKLERRQGRPKAGRAIFTQAHVDALPDYSTVLDVSRALQVKHTSIQQWCVHGDNPLRYGMVAGHKVFRKDVLITWLEATGRYNVEVTAAN